MKSDCYLCRGQGTAITISCRTCKGTGYDPEEDKPFAQCHSCYGDGVEDLDECPECHNESFFNYD